MKVMNFPLLDTNSFCPKKEISYIHPSLAHNSTVLDDLTIEGCSSRFLEANWAKLNENMVRIATLINCAPGHNMLGM
jgi:hypothetical protein